jgi:Spy/CpxP family protein refolding chaperone
MKQTIFLLLGALLPVGAIAADASADPLAGAFFPPEMILMASDQIGITQQQQEDLRSRVEKIQPRSEELRVKLERETSALSTLAKQNHVDEAAILSQLDRVLDAERELKHLHIGLVVQVKNMLTVEQQAKLRAIAASGGAQLAEATRKRLTGKVQEVEAGMQKWAESGRDPSSIAQEMEEKFKPLIEAGKVSEAEAAVDRVLQELKKD